MYFRAFLTSAPNPFSVVSNGLDFVSLSVFCVQAKPTAHIVHVASSDNKGISYSGTLPPHFVLYLVKSSTQVCTVT